MTRLSQSSPAKLTRLEPSVVAGGSCMIMPLNLFKASLRMSSSGRSKRICLTLDKPRWLCLAIGGSHSRPCTTVEFSTSLSPLLVGPKSNTVSRPGISARDAPAAEKSNLPSPSSQGRRCRFILLCWHWSAIACRFQTLSFCSASRISSFQTWPASCSTAPPGEGTTLGSFLHDP